MLRRLVFVCGNRACHRDSTSFPPVRTALFRTGGVDNGPSIVSCLKHSHLVYSLRMWHLAFQTHPLFVTAKGMTQPCDFVHGQWCRGRSDRCLLWYLDCSANSGAWGPPCFIRPRTRTPERLSADTPPLSWRGGSLARKTSLASSLVTPFSIFKDSQWFALTSYGSATILAQGITMFVIR